jgi:hypothetical protein
MFVAPGKENFLKSSGAYIAFWIRKRTLWQTKFLWNPEFQKGNILISYSGSVPYRKALYLASTIAL